MQDLNRSITVEDLIRKYNLDKIKLDRKKVESLTEGLHKTDGILSNFVEQTTRDIENLQDQVDGNITTWFYSGVPTLSNNPAVNWTDNDTKINHLGDLYYDQNTGYCYRFAYEQNTFSWIKLTDSDITEALSIANSAKDTADAKRRVFVVQPIPPYDAGDVWWNNGELFRCSVGRQATDTFHSTDWVDDLKYTDDSAANNVKAELDSFKEVVAEDYTTSATFTTQINAIQGTVDEIRTTTVQQNDELTRYKSEVSSTFTQQANSFELAFNNLNEVVNETRGIAEQNDTSQYLRYTANTGVEIGDTDSPFKVNITNQEFNIQQNGNKVAYINDNTLLITEADILQRLYMGNFGFVVNQDGSVSFRKVRDN